MKNRLLIALVVVAIFSGVAITYAQRPKRSGVTGSKIMATRQKQGTVFNFPRPPGMPTPEAIHAKIREDFLNKKYEGTRLALNPSLAGDALALHKSLEEAFRAADFTLPERVGHFAWVQRNPDLRHRGWVGNIKETVPADRGMMVSVRFFPLLDSMARGKAVVTGDSVLETYFFDGKALRYMRSDLDPDSHPMSLIMD